MSAARARDAAAMRRRLAEARQLLSQLAGAWAAGWADSVRQDAEARHGVAAGATDLDDAEYDLALDVGAAIGRAQMAIDDAEARFNEAEATAGTKTGQ